MKNPYLLTAALALPLLSFATSCSTVAGLRDSGPGEVDAGLLQYADESATDAVREARLEVAAEKDALEAVRLKLKDARQMRELVNEREHVAEEQLDVAERREQIASRNQVVEASAEMANEREAELRTARNRVKVYEQMIEARERELDLAKARVDHAQSIVQLRMAEAVSGLQRKDANSIDVADFEADVRDERTNVELATTRFQGALRELKVSQKSFDGDVALFPEMKEEFDSLLSQLKES
ncbi:hypothetical protein Poly30_45510 [Planctomycetes bacterium Poly30]|uniref:Chromosome partition protein Smc n=1 Tax=Saltatorellus ferox TaxID=2528018 RepID=A0A518EY25_9BACT|nr:hypothetical protein Poly30_45510 [Planctomycetes bacterium Poly30]